MMAGVVERWLKHQNEWPDLVILDGGKTHLSAVLSMLDSHGLAGVFPVIALAKREETVFTEDGREFVLDRQGRMIVHARDEAHRFVNSYHRKKRSKGSLRNPLENVEGLGAKKIQTLLRHFGGIQGIEHASLEELKAIQGIGKELAKRIQRSFNKY
jgi:excinuclease ABC subunit C|tara:strand:- start:685 stop:1152 length:468 start_codon:yes stop_codon:yes gene_type:complete